MIDMSNNITRDNIDETFKLSISTVKAMRRLKFTTAETYVYLYLLSRANGYEDGTCYMSTEALMRELDMPKTTAHRSKSI